MALGSGGMAARQPVSKPTRQARAKQAGERSWRGNWEDNERSLFAGRAGHPPVWGGSRSGSGDESYLTWRIVRGKGCTGSVRGEESGATTTAANYLQAGKTLKSR